MAELFESEARHHTTYVQLARTFAPDQVVANRLEALAVAEAEIVVGDETLVRMHS